jgi:hypothetical protein
MKLVLALVIALIALSGCTQTDLNSDLNNFVNPGSITDAAPVFDSNQYFTKEDDIISNAVQHKNEITVSTIRAIQTGYAADTSVQNYRDDIETGILLFSEATIEYRSREETDTIWISGTDKNYVMLVPIVEEGANLTKMGNCTVATHLNLQHNCDLEITYCEPEWTPVPDFLPHVKYIIDASGVYHFAGIEYPC